VNIEISLRYLERSTAGALKQVAHSTTHTTREIASIGEYAVDRVIPFGVCWRKRTISRRIIRRDLIVREIGNHSHSNSWRIVTRLACLQCRMMKAGCMTTYPMMKRRILTTIIDCFFIGGLSTKAKPTCYTVTLPVAVTAVVIDAKRT
jgi:hypothetical protein